MYFVTRSQFKLHNLKGALHELNQIVYLIVNHFVLRRRVARDARPQLKLT